MAGLNWLISQLRKVTSGGVGAERMTADLALSYAPVWYAVNKIAGHVAYLPLNLHRESGKSNIKQTRHAAYRLMRVRSNDYQTPYVFKRQMMAHALLWGNGRAYIHRGGLRTELIPLMPDRCQTMLVEGEKVHFYKIDRDERLELWEDIKRAMAVAKREGTDPGVIAIPDSEILHIHGLGFDGVEGKSLIKLASQSWSLGVGAESQERSKQRKGYSGGLMLQAPAGAFRKEDEAKEFLKWFRESHEGEGNAGKTGLLREGITANVLAMSNTDAQFIEQRKFQRQEAALWFLLEQILGDDSSVSYNSLEQKNLAYLQNCLAPWLTIWEEESEAKLLTQREMELGYYFKFNDGALLRTDKQTTATIVSTLISSRVINPNEGREMFDMNPYEGGDVFENPATTSGEPGSTSDSDTGEPESPDTTAATQNRLAVESRLSHMLGVEINRVKKGVQAKNFLAWLDKFYDGWESTLGDVCEELGIERDAAVQHCRDSKDHLLACAGEAVTTDELKEQVAVCVGGWQERTGTLLENMELAEC